MISTLKTAGTVFITGLLVANNESLNTFFKDAWSWMKKVVRAKPTEETTNA